jgi:hypothetical protein
MYNHTIVSTMQLSMKLSPTKGKGEYFNPSFLKIAAEKYAAKSVDNEHG